MIPPQTSENYKNIAFRGRPAAKCTVMAESIRVAQPIRFQHLHWYTSRILVTMVRNPLKLPVDIQTVVKEGYH